MYMHIIMEAGMHWGISEFELQLTDLQRIIKNLVSVENMYITET